MERHAAHCISLEALHSGIYQDLDRPRRRRAHVAPAFNHSLWQSVYRVLSEVRFFRSYVHHVAISDAAGEMLLLRDVRVPDPQPPRARTSSSTA
ncbi:hypothetical protein E2562_017030 [Oryza meyeriana var. granulata]|uniref:Uncharacterized protein n=1 Tax=Oryza meyeriana var. granulata TaxID=110450 RepID=A0A6G1EAJ6_9ORYZ|nr:hypothetical protein E2562_017030 [Oryza meyeriana var. granulata]